MNELWTSVDQYIVELLVPSDPALDAALVASEAAGLPAIQVSPAQGKLLYLLARIRGARSILEIGTLGGYSTIWLARALPPGGRVVSLELEASYAAVAQANIARAGVGELVEIRVGPALDSLAEIAGRGEEPYDLVFFDADKARTPEYFIAALPLVREGALLIFDNSVRGGEVADPDSADRGARGMRRMHELLAAEPRVTATTIQTVGAKGYDGFTLALLDTPPAGGV